jgi:hypothetical protein
MKRAASLHDPGELLGAVEPAQRRAADAAWSASGVEDEPVARVPSVQLLAAQAGLDAVDLVSLDDTVQRDSM